MCVMEARIPLAKAVTCQQPLLGRRLQPAAGRNNYKSHDTTLIPPASSAPERRAFLPCSERGQPPGPTRVMSFGLLRPGGRKLALESPDCGPGFRERPRCLRRDWSVNSWNCESAPARPLRGSRHVRLSAPPPVPPLAHFPARRFLVLGRDGRLVSEDRGAPRSGRLHPMPGLRGALRTQAEQKKA